MYSSIRVCVSEHVFLFKLEEILFLRFFFNYLCHLLAFQEFWFRSINMIPNILHFGKFINCKKIVFFFSHFLFCFQSKIICKVIWSLRFFYTKKCTHLDTKEKKLFLLLRNYFTNKSGGVVCMFFNVWLVCLCAFVDEHFFSSKNNAFDYWFYSEFDNFQTIQIQD